MGSFRRCLTALVVFLAIGVGPVVSEASAGVGDERGRGSEGHASKDYRGSEESGRARCEAHQARADENRERDRQNGDRQNGDRQKDEGCKNEGNHGEKGHDGEGHDGEGHRDEDHRDEGYRDEGYRDEGHDSEDHEEESHRDDGAGQGEVRGNGHRQRSDAAVPGVRVAPIAPTPTPETPNGPVGGTLELTVRASRVVARVGDEIAYTVTVTNTGAAEFVDVVVVDLVPPELDVVSVPLAEGVAAQQAGRSPRGEDVVWILEPLPARASVELSWTGIVRKAGDLEATNVVIATFDGSEVRASTTTFLATATGVTAQRTAPEVRPKRIVTVTRVRTVDLAGGAVLPVTGVGIEWFIWLAIAIGLAGIVLLILGRPLSLVALSGGFTLALISIIYIGIVVIEESPPPRPTPRETVEDEVRGKQIVRNGATPDAGPRGSPSPKPRRDDRAREAPVSSGREPSRTVVVRTTRTVKVPVDASPIASGAGDNELSFSWDEDTRRILQAASSRGPLTASAPSELLTSLGETEDAIEGTLVLRNVSDDLIAVDGVLLHEIRGDGVSLTLRTKPIDVVLRPGGLVRATFMYLLPSGDYQAGASFVAD